VTVAGLGVDGLTVLLCAARVVPICLFAPLAGGGVAPGAVRLGTAAVLVAFLAPRLSTRVGAANLPLALLAEVLLGSVLALVAAVPLFAARMAGSLADAARAVSPPDGQSPLATWLELLALMLFFALGAHLVLIGNLAETFRSLPVGLAPVDPSRLLPLVLDASAHVFEAAIAVAAPLLLAQLFAEVAVVVAGRIAGTSLGPATAGVRSLAAVAGLLVSFTAVSLALRGELARAIALSLP
jgi:flagellar biosynthesis protein FliR